MRVTLILELTLTSGAGGSGVGAPAASLGLTLEGLFEKDVEGCEGFHFEVEKLLLCFVSLASMRMVVMPLMRECRDFKGVSNFPAASRDSLRRPVMRIILVS